MVFMIYIVTMNKYEEAHIALLKRFAKGKSPGKTPEHDAPANMTRKC
jgi:hypothetical protein